MFNTVSSSGLKRKVIYVRISTPTTMDMDNKRNKDVFNRHRLYDTGMIPKDTLNRYRDRNCRTFKDGNLKCEKYGRLQDMRSDFSRDRCHSRSREYHRRPDREQIDRRSREYDGCRSREYDGGGSREYDGGGSREYDGGGSCKYEGGRSREYDGGRSREYSDYRSRHHEGRRSCHDSSAGSHRDYCELDSSNGQRLGSNDDCTDAKCGRNDFHETHSTLDFRHTSALTVDPKDDCGSGYIKNLSLHSEKEEYKVKRQYVKEGLEKEYGSKRENLRDSRAPTLLEDQNSVEYKGKDVQRSTTGSYESHKNGDEEIRGVPSKPKEVEKPNFNLSGALLEESNMKNGILLKYSEPPEARSPQDLWRIYVFRESDKEKESKILYLHSTSCFIIGKEPRVAEILLVHPTISKQHAAIQFRLHKNGSVRPYLIDLESTNGSFLNGERIEPLRYYELRNGDSLRFARSSRDLIVTKESDVQQKKLSYAEYVDLEVNAYSTTSKKIQ